ncbi:MAG TPA: hypothetical protein VGQ73_09835 [Gemmatimonadales bacterium]|jgi:hypothetical protein|nr:hypothetical protein [Gemmatimonadales bacterium]
MPGPSVVELISQLNFAVESLEVRFHTGEVEVRDIEELKGTIDDARLRLWSLLTIPADADRVAFEERFRIRRARELCGRLARDLEAKKIRAREPEFAELAETNRSLARAIEAATPLI